MFPLFCALKTVVPGNDFLQTAKEKENMHAESDSEEAKVIIKEQD